MAVAQAADMWKCQTCGDTVRELPRHVIEKNYGADYAKQTRFQPCSCLRKLENNDEKSK